MSSVSINPPKTPVTKGSLSIAKATLPNVCKMPGPPAPFVPTPLPNIGKSSDSPKGYSTSVKIEGDAVAIQGATFNSMGDIASKALGGGLVSMNTHGATSFIGLGAMDVQIEGKNVQLLGDPMLNNNGPSGSPPNSATMGGVKHKSGKKAKKDKVDCKKLKAKWGIESGTHKENTSGKTKKNSTDYQSHHVLQDAIMPEGICARNDAQAVMLHNSVGGTEHQTINASQTTRNASKKQPTFGQLKKDAKADLAKGLEGRRTKNGKSISKKEAEQLAECLVSEAEKVAKDQAKRNGKKLNDSTLMNAPAGCFRAGTRVQLASGVSRLVELLRRGDRVRTEDGEAEVTRLETCRHSLVELIIGNDALTVASHHYLHDADGYPVRAESVRVGDLVTAANGPVPVSQVRFIQGSFLVHRVGLSRAATCLLGSVGLVAELPYLGPPLVRHETVEHFVSGAR